MEPEENSLEQPVTVPQGKVIPVTVNPAAGTPPVSKVIQAAPAPEASWSSSLQTESSLGAVPPPRPRRGISLLRFNRGALVATALIIAVIGGLIGGGAYFSRLSQRNNIGSSAKDRYSVGSLSLQGLKVGRQLEVGEVDHLDINGQLKVTNTVIVTPTTAPSKPATGQIYYDTSTNQPYFYNGKQFISMAQAPPAVPLAGRGITVNGTTIQNSGVININSGSPNVVVANDGQGNFTVSATSGITDVLTGTGVVNQIAVFTGTRTLGSSVLSQIGGQTIQLNGVLDVSQSATVGGTLTATGGVVTNSLQQTGVGNNLAVSAGNDELIFTAGGRNFRFPTSGGGSQTICTNSVTCASGAGTAVLLQPGSPQADSGTGPAIYINNTGGGDLIRLQGAGTDRYIVDNNGNMTALSGRFTSMGAGLVLSDGSGNLTSGSADRNSSTYFSNQLSVANGGTGVATLTTNGLLFGNGVGAVQATGSAANSVLATNGSSVPSLVQTLPTAVQGNITGTGALVNGSIASGFGVISTTNGIGTTGALQGGTLNIAGGSFSVNGSGALAATGVTSSGTITFSGLTTGVVHANASGVISSGPVDLGSETTGSYVANLGTLTGLGTSGNSGAGSTPTLSVLYGSIGQTAVQGNTQLVCASGTGNLSGGGNSITLGAGGTCGNLTITNSPTFSGDLAVQGSGGVVVGVPSTTDGVLKLANAGSSFTGGVKTVALGQATTYLLPDPGQASVTLCLNTGNCAGSGGGVTTTGGTAGQIVKFTGAQTIADSILSESGSTITASGNLVVTGAFSLTLGTASTNTGSLALRNSTNANVITLLSGASASTFSLVLPTTQGSNGDCLMNGGSGVLTFGACTGGAGGGVTSLNGQTGVISVLNASGSGGIITIDDASTTAKGIAQFNSTNFTASSGVVNTIQDIASSASPTFTGLTLSNALSVANGGTGANTFTSNGILFGNSTGSLQVTTAAANSVLVTNGSNVPGLSQILPTSVQGNITNVGTLSAGSIASGFGAILTGNTITGTTLNGTTGINTGNGAGTQRIDSSGNLVNIGTITAGLINGQTISSSANFTGTVAIATLGSVGGTAVCLNVSNQLATCNNNAAGVTLQQAYNVSTDPEIVVDATRGALTVRDASTPIGANLFEVQNNAGSSTYFAVTVSGASIDGNLTVTTGTISGNGSGLTGLNASNISSGTLSDSRLSTNVALLNGTGPQTFTGNNRFSGTFLAQNASNSTTAFQIQNAAGNSNLFVADTTNNCVSIGTSPNCGYKLYVNGAGGIGTSSRLVLANDSTSSGYISKSNTVGTGGVSANDVVVLDSSGRIVTTTVSRDRRVYGVAESSAAAGVSAVGTAISGNFLVNADTAAVAVDDQLVTSSTAGKVTVDNNATTGILGYATTSKVAGSPGTVAVRIQVNAGQYSPTFRNATDSTTAFQIQNASGNSNLFVADTTNTRIGIGAPPANGLLTVGTATTAASGGIYFGTDTNLYRSAADSLKTDDTFTANGINTYTSVAQAGLRVSSSGTNFIGYVSYIGAETQGRFVVRSEGLLQWGDGTLAVDTNLYRSAADTLKTDDNFVIGNSGGSTTLTVNGSLGAISTSTTGNNLNFSRSGSNYITATDAAGLLSFGAGGNTAQVTLSAAGNLGIGIQPSNGQGLLQFAAGTTAANGIQFGTDTNLYRTGTNQLRTDGSLGINTSLGGGTAGIWLDSGNYIDITRTSGTAALRVFSNAGDTQPSIIVGRDGKMYWGPGGSTVPDAVLYRSAADTLKTDDYFIQGNLTTHTTLYTGFDGQTTNVIEAGSGTLTTSSASGYGQLTLTNNVNNTNSLVGAMAFVNLNTGSTEKRLATVSGWTDGANNSGKMLFATANAGTVNTVATLDKSGNFGLGITPTASAGLLQLASGTTAANGIAFGTDTNLYRSAANGLQTDSSLRINTTASSALLVQNAAGAALFNVDTSGKQIIMNNLGSAAGGITFSGAGSIGSGIWFTNANTSIRNDGGSNELLDMYVPASGAFVYNINNVEKARLNANGFGIGATPVSGAGLLQLAAGTTAANGIQFGTDTNLYRSAADTLRTDDNFITAGLLTVAPTGGAAHGQGLRLQNGAGGRTWELKAGSPGVNNDYFTLTDITAPNAIRLTVDDTGKLGLGGVTAPTASISLQADTTAAGGIAFGTDTNLYRSGANTLKTDDNFLVQTAIDSATAFQIQNSAGSSFLTVDTTNGVTTASTLAASNISSSGRFLLNTGASNNGYIGKVTTIGTGGVSANDVVVMANDGGSMAAVTTTTARDPRVYGVATSTAAAGGLPAIAIGGNFLVNADTAAVAIGDQLVTSSTGGKVTVDNNATTGILGYATTAKAAGSAGTVGVRIQVTTGQYSPTFRNASDSTAALQVQNAVGTAVMQVNTSAQSLILNGTAGSTTFTGNNITFSRNSANYLQATDSAGYLILGSGGTNNDFYINTNGSAKFVNHTDSSTGFQIMNSGNTSLFRVDTSGRNFIFENFYTGGRLIIQQGGSAGVQLSFNTQGSYIANNGGSNEFLQFNASGTNAANIFNVGGTEVARINANGLGVGVTPAASAGLLQLASGTTAANGIAFGTDTNLYRTAADTLKTDDNLTVAGSGGISIGAIGANGNLNFLRTSDAAAVGNILLSGSVMRYTASGGGAAHSWYTNNGTNTAERMQLNAAGQLQLTTQGSTGGILIGGDASIYRSNANILTTPGTFVANNFNATGTGTALTGYSVAASQFIRNYLTNTDTQPAIAIQGDGKLLWGAGGSTATDTNLYRSAADTLKTDDTFDALAYKVGGTAGSSVTCSGGQFLQNQVVNGGIVTGGSCATVAADTLQQAYNASTNPEIVVDTTRGALTVRDASIPIGANLLEVQSNNGSTTYFGVTASGTIINGSLNVNTGSITGNGSGITNLNASNISNGTLSDARLSSNVALLNGTGPQTFSGNNKFTGTLGIQTNSTAAFSVQNAGTGSLVNVDTVNNVITLNGNNSGELGSWTTTSTLPANSMSAGVVAGRGYVYVIGGSNTGYPTGSVSTVYFAKVNADGSVGSWQTASNALPAARQALSSVYANGYIYAIGGADSSSVVYSTVYFAKVNADGSVGSWQTASNALPAARKYHKSFVANGYVYVIGGYDGASAQSTVYFAKVNADGSVGSWQTASNPLPVAMSSHSAATSNGYAYLSMGRHVYYSKLNAATGQPGTWTTQSNIHPVDINSAASVVMNGYFYTIGGCCGGAFGDNSLNTVYYAKLNSDGSLGSFTLASNILGSSQQVRGVTVYNGNIYSIGGINANSGLTTNTVEYASGQRLKVGGSLDLVGYSGGNLAEGEGGSGGELTAGNTNVVGDLKVQGQTSFLQGVSIDKTLTVNGDALFRNTANSTTAFQVQSSDGGSLLNVDTLNNVVTVNGNNSAELNTWTATSTLPASRQKAGVAVGKGFMYVIGGGSSNLGQTTVYYSKVNVDGSVNAWQTASNTLPAGRAGLSSVYANGYIYAIGGWDSTATTVQSSVYYARVNADGSPAAWQTASNSLPAIRALHKSFVANGYVYVVGGATNVTGTSTVATIYYAKLNADGSVGSWQTAANALPGATSEHAVASANGYIYVTSGTNAYYSKLDAGTGAPGTWTTQSGPPTITGPITGAAAVIMNGYFYNIGGCCSGFGGSRSMNEVYAAKLNSNGSLGTFTLNTNTMFSRDDYHGALTYNGYIYALGGWDESGGNPDNTVQYASGQRLKVAGSLDLTGYSGGNLAEDSSASGGELTAGNTNVVGELRVQGQASFQQGVSIDKSLNVNSDALFKNSANSTTAFQIQNASGTSLFTVNTTSSMITIGSASAVSQTSTTRVYDGAVQRVYGQIVYKNKLYAGLYGTSNGDGDVVVCDPTTAGVASQCDNASDWTTSFNGPFLGAVSFSIYNDKLYAGLIGGAGGNNDIYVCDPTVSGDTSVCETGDWSQSYDGSNFYGFRVMQVFNGRLYAGQQSSIISTGGDVYVCNPATTGGATTCETGDWSLAYDTAASWVESMAVYDGKLYIGYSDWSLSANENMSVCDPTGGGVSTICDNASDWSTISSYNGGNAAYGEAPAMKVLNDKLYVGFGVSANNGDIQAYDSKLGTWTTIFDGSGIEEIDSMITYNGKLIFGVGNSTGDGDVYEYDPSLPMSSPLARVTQLPDAGNQEGIYSLAAFNGYVYIGQGNSTGDSDIYMYQDARTSSIPLNFQSGSGSSVLTGNLWFEQDLQGTAANPGYNLGYFKMSNSLVTEAGAYDLAEDYPTRDDGLGAADIVAVDPAENGFVKRASGDSRGTIVGVYSSNPGLRLSQKESAINGGRAVPVALAGRIPVKVSAENGAIKPGDAITIGSQPGVGVKATGAGRVIGMAMEGFDGPGTGTVVVFLNPSWYDPQLGLQGNAQLDSLNVSGQATINDLTVTIARVGTLEINGHIITKGDKPLGEVMTALGSNAKLEVDGNDTAGTVTITTGADGLTAGDLGKIRFNKAFGRAPRIIISAQDDNSANARIFPTGKTDRFFILKSGQALQPNTVYIFDYFIAE